MEVIEKYNETDSGREAMKAVPMTLTESELVRLDEVRKEMGLRSRSELIRHLIVTHPTYRNGFQQP